MPEQSLAQTPQLDFALGNPDAPGTVYVSTDPADNQLTLTMSATVAASFSAGTLVPPSQAMGGSGSLLYLDVTNLGMTAAEFAAIALVADGWTSALYTESGNQYIGFTPAAAVSLAPTPAEISFSITNFTLAQAPGDSASLSALSYRVSGITSGSFPSQSSLSIVFAVPDDNTGDLTTAMAVSMSPDEVVCSVQQYPAIANDLTLTFTQQPNAPTIHSGDDTVFTLNFVYASDVNGFGALLTTDEGKQVTVTAALGTTDWTITPNLDANPPFWTLTPPPNQPLFGSSRHASLAFDIGSIVTMFQPGPTVALIGYSGVPGYKPGSFAVTLLKEPHVVISEITVSPQQSVLEDGEAQVTVSWSTTNATQLTLQPLGADVTGKTQMTATISDTTEFTLVAEGQRPGNVDNVASMSALAQVLPVINGFTATPSAIYLGDFGSGYPTNLAWNVNTNDQVTLTSSVSGPIGPSYPPISSAQLNLQSSQMLTLTPQGGTDDPTVSRSLIVSGFQVEAAQVQTGYDSGYAAAPPNASFIAVTAPGNNQVAILSTANFQPITTVPTGARPLGIAFSPNGSVMYVANSGDSTVSVFAVASTQGAIPFSFTLAATVAVGGAPQAVTVGPDGTAYVTVDLTSTGQVAVITASNGSYSAGTPIPVGQGPAGLAISPSGASLYVANTNSNSISLVTLGGSAPSVGTVLTGIGGPKGIAVTPDGKKLLVAASQDGQVYGFNTQSPATSPRQTYALQGATGLGVFPSGDYAVATSASAHSCALINYAKGTVSETVALPAAALGAAVMPEGGVGVVALPGTNSVEVLTFAQYAQVAATTAAGGEITNVAISADGDTLIGWYDAGISITGGSGQPISGILKGPAGGTSTTHYLQGTSVNWVAVSPVVADNAFYLAQHSAAQIDVYSVSSVTSIGSIPIPAQNGETRRAVGLGVSGDGKTLFALVSNGATSYSLLVVAADIASKTFTVSADIAFYTARMGQLNTPFAVAETSSGGWAAYAVDTTSATLWTATGSGSNWTVGTGLALAPGHAPTANAIACTPDGAFGYVSMQSGLTVYMAVIDLNAQSARLVQLPNNAIVTNFSSLATSGDGKSLYASDLAASGIRILDAASLRIDQTLSWQSNVQMPWGIAAAADGTAIFAANVLSQNIAIAQQVTPT